MTCQLTASLSLLAFLSLAACGPMTVMFGVDDPFAIPKPFAEGSLVVRPVSAAARPITIHPVADLAQADAERLQKAILGASNESDVLAVAPGTPQQLGLMGRFDRIATSAEYDVARVAWRMGYTDGRIIEEFTVDAPWQHAEGEQGLPESTARDLATKTVARLQQTLSPDTAPVPTAGGGPDAGGTQGERTVFIAPLKGAPGDGDRSLHAALSAILDSHPDLAIVAARAKAQVLIDVRISFTHLTAQEDKIELVWRLTSSDGRELGVVEQSNDVPRGLLDGRWGNTALDAAYAAAGGIVDVLTRSEGAAATSR